MFRYIGLAYADQRNLLSNKEEVPALVREHDIDKVLSYY